MTDITELAQRNELARMALAAMGSEPVAYMHDGEDGTEYNGHNEFSGGGKGIPLYRHAQPATVVLVVPDEMTAEQAHEVGDYYGDPVDVFARGANWMRQHIIDSTLAVSSQEVKK